MKYTRYDVVKTQTESETERLKKQGGKIVDKVTETGTVLEKGTATGLPYKTAKRIARQNAVQNTGYVVGALGKSEVAGNVSRRERRKAARNNKGEFTPIYNGESPQTYEKYYGVGYERFNNKFVEIKKAN